MPRLTAAAVALALAATAAAAQEIAPPEGDGVLDSIGRVNAAEYIREVLRNQEYDPRDRERALNGAPQALSPHWRSSIFDGRRTRTTSGTGLRLPDLTPRDTE